MDGTWRKATRRAYVQALGALGAGAALAACGQGTASEGERAGQPSRGRPRWSWGTTSPRARGRDLIQSSARRFQEEHPNLTVETQPVTGNYWEALITRLAGGTAPDICIGSGATFLGLLEKNSWQQVDAYLRRDRSVDLKAYYSQPEIFDKDGKHYGLPFMINTTVLLLQQDPLPDAPAWPSRPSAGPGTTCWTPRAS